jgi:hypothetical protein
MPDSSRAPAGQIFSCKSLPGCACRRDRMPEIARRGRMDPVLRLQCQTMNGRVAAPALYSTISKRVIREADVAKESTLRYVAVLAAFGWLAPAALAQDAGQNWVTAWGTSQQALGESNPARSAVLILPRPNPEISRLLVAPAACLGTLPKCPCVG